MPPEDTKPDEKDERSLGLIRRAVREELQTGINARYVECSGCGDAILKANAAKRGCLACGLVLKDGKWVPKSAEKPASALDDFLR